MWLCRCGQVRWWRCDWQRVDMAVWGRVALRFVGWWAVFGPLRPGWHYLAVLLDFGIAPSAAPGQHLAPLPGGRRQV